MPHILIVDDDVHFCEVLQAYLENHGFRISIAGTAREAIDFLQSGGLPDLILSDIRLPDVDGVALQSLSEELGFEIPFLFISSNNAWELSKFNIIPPDVDVLHKPFELRTLLTRVQSRLDERPSLGRQK